MNALNAILHAQEAMVPAIERALQRILSVYGTPKQHQTKPGKCTTVPKVDEGINILACKIGNNLMRRFYNKLHC